MRPFSFFNCFFVFSSTCVDGAFCFSYVDRCGFAGAVKFVNAIALARFRAFFFPEILEFVAAFMIEVATSFGKGFFESLRYTRDVAECSVGSETYV